MSKVYRRTKLFRSHLLNARWHGTPHILCKWLTVRVSATVLFFIFVQGGSSMFGRQVISCLPSAQGLSQVTLVFRHWSPGCAHGQSQLTEKSLSIQPTPLGEDNNNNRLPTPNQTVRNRKEHSFRLQKLLSTPTFLTYIATDWPNDNGPQQKTGRRSTVQQPVCVYIRQKHEDREDKPINKLTILGAPISEWHSRHATQSKNCNVFKAMKRLVQAHPKPPVAIAKRITEFSSRIQALSDHNFISSGSGCDMPIPKLCLNLTGEEFSWILWQMTCDHGVSKWDIKWQLKCQTNNVHLHLHTASWWVNIAKCDPILQAVPCINQTESRYDHKPPQPVREFKKKLPTRWKNAGIVGTSISQQQQQQQRQRLPDPGGLVSRRDSVGLVRSELVQCSQHAPYQLRRVLHSPGHKSRHQRSANGGKVPTKTSKCKKRNIYWV